MSAPEQPHTPLPWDLAVGPARDDGSRDTALSTLDNERVASFHGPHALANALFVSRAIAEHAELAARAEAQELAESTAHALRMENEGLRECLRELNFACESLVVMIESDPSHRRNSTSLFLLASKARRVLSRI